MDIQIFQTTDDLNRSFTEWLKEITTKKEIMTIALSGGSTPKSLFDYWASLPSGEIEWAKIKFFWGDERCVPPTDEESNYNMTKKHLFDFVPIPPEHIFRIQGENDPIAEAKRYGKTLSHELESMNGTPTFDIMMLGMGDDGHTASIFPHQIDLWHSSNNCVTAAHPVSGQTRVSLSGKVINSARNVAFLVTGANKADKVKEIIDRPEQAEKKYPAALVRPDSGNLVWFLDEEAAQELTGRE
ncbi:6-phosphogluconolactonase [Proteiniphilum sp. UBA1028]|jgi:6-phosphogluconolactonase|uniref:6-phosphogluconolactonase n=1 Tax=Proteiniphilum sp. UBA1028 TaxID=1947251 RepID=UPI000E822B4F|nr:6-phosphogluconolactonase [Proteiniphilum sp. UBA1028]HBG58885.1 6-phosphogluconolactonase [Porphyromonadaceae bacterium]